MHCKFGNAIPNCWFKFLAAPERMVNAPAGSLSEDESSSSDSSDCEDSESVTSPVKSKRKQLPNDTVDEFNRPLCNSLKKTLSDSNSTEGVGKASCPPR